MAQTFDVVIRNALVVDGTGAPGYAGEIAIAGDRIAQIGKIDGSRGTLEIDAKGKAVAPGFIDAHTHDDRLLLSAPDMAPKVSQGVTTVVAGNCGISLAPMPRPFPGAVTPPLDLLDDGGSWFRFPTFRAYVDELNSRRAAINCALLVGHTTLRLATMDDVERPATPAEIAKMREMVGEALAAGAIGASTGLYYEPAAAAPASEVVDVMSPLRQYGGIYCTHMRNEGEHILDSLRESFDSAKAMGVPVVISHHKVAGRPNHGRSTETLAYIQDRMRGQPIGLDCYPYNASSTVLSADRAAIASRTVVTWSKARPDLAGRDIADIAATLGVSEEAAIAQLLPAGAIYFSMDEADVQRILSYPPTMVGSDGLPHDAFPHPRLWATFPRVLGHYSRDVGLFSLEQAVHKMTGLTAGTFGLKDRGVLREGAYADITMFDPATVDEGATFEHPIEMAPGIDTVLVNGTVVWRGGKASGARPGRVLSRARAV
jgi:N-acyl-D-amino-acid deacylase